VKEDKHNKIYYNTNKILIKQIEIKKQ